MTPDEQSEALVVRLRELEAASALRFEILRRAGKVAGEFLASTWLYSGRNFRFLERTKPKVALQRDPDSLPGIAGTLARCFIVASMEQRLSGEGVYARLQGVRWLAQVTGGGIKPWLALTPAVLNRVIANLQRENSEATVYNRVSALLSFIDFLNGTRTGSKERASTLLGRHISWNPGLKNPIRRSIEIDAAEVDALGKRK